MVFIFIGGVVAVLAVGVYALRRATAGLPELTEQDRLEAQEY